jgi:transposase
MAHRHGRAPRGGRPVDTAPYGHWRTTTSVAGLRGTGIVVPPVLDGPMTGKAFRAYVEEALAPALEPGNVAVMDNLAAHKIPGVSEASKLPVPVFSASRHLLDLNRIEQAFAKLKTKLRPEPGEHTCPRKDRGHGRCRDPQLEAVSRPLDSSGTYGAA